MYTIDKNQITQHQKKIEQEKKLVLLFVKIILGQILFTPPNPTYGDFKTQRYTKIIPWNLLQVHSPATNRHIMNSENIILFEDHVIWHKYQRHKEHPRPQLQTCDNY